MFVECQKTIISLPTRYQVLFVLKAGEKYREFYVEATLVRGIKRLDDWVSIRKNKEGGKIS